MCSLGLRSAGAIWEAENHNPERKLGWTFRNNYNIQASQWQLQKILEFISALLSDYGTLVYYYCCHKLPKTYWLEATQIYCLTVLWVGYQQGSHWANIEATVELYSFLENPFSCLFHLPETVQSPDFTFKCSNGCLSLFHITSLYHSVFCFLPHVRTFVSILDSSW